MKDADQVLREKELRLSALRREVEALRMVAALLIDEAEIAPKIPPQSEHGNSNILEGTSGSSVKAPVRFWPY